MDSGISLPGFIPVQALQSGYSQTIGDLDMLTDGHGLDWGWVVGGGREGNGNPLQYSCLENPRDG